MRVISDGQLSGSSAVSTHTAMAAGTYFTGTAQASGSVYVKVTVTGQTAPEGKVWALRLSDGVVVALTDSEKPGTQFVGAFDHLTLSTTVAKTGIEPAADTLGDLAQGGIHDTGSPDGDLGIKCSVMNGADSVSAGVGNSWRYLFKATAVIAVADSTAVESYGASAIDAIYTA